MSCRFHHLVFGENPNTRKVFRPIHVPQQALDVRCGTSILRVTRPPSLWNQNRYSFAHDGTRECTFSPHNHARYPSRLETRSTSNPSQAVPPENSWATEPYPQSGRPFSQVPKTKVSLPVRERLSQGVPAWAPFGLDKVPRMPECPLPCWCSEK